ncbi:MAG: ABC transporter permease [Cyclobacteriaceae bacterium]|nr:ABC transporter permease [Cyclobacteriaceae bacterium]MDH4294978.1 ABC transporter permease [Cyclobacteriaceae bacterium]MDH5249016.1 ABC transporter permease [Cyclobacteriaceae bacterium]
MLKNYLLTASRILIRQKAYSAINIFGLTLGIACSLLILLYIADELKYDRFHTDSGRTYRVGFVGKFQDTEIYSAQAGAPLSRALMEEVPQVESTIRLQKWNTYPVRFEEKAFTEKGFIAADSNFFEFFNFKLIAGNTKDALRGPNKAVITENAARRYLDYKGPGDNSPIGKLFVGGSAGELTFEVSGIAENPPTQSHIQFDFVLSLDSSPDARNEIWVNASYLTYFKIKPNAQVADVKSQLDYFVEKYMGGDIEKYLGVTMEQFRAQGNTIGFIIQALPDIHLYSRLRDDITPPGSIQYVYLFGATAIFIILLACINFMNLSTARSANRAKEVGIRKTIGAVRQRLIGQFLMESYLYVSIAVIIALAVVSIALNSFNLLAGKNLTVGMMYSPFFVGGLAAFIVLLGLIAGSYPAFYLTAFKPAEVLKGKIRAGMKSSGIRNVLVVFQFFISIALIISSMIVYKQLNHLQKVDIGFNKANLLNLLHTINLNPNAEAFRNELLQHTEIVGASYANRLPPNLDWNSVFRPEGNEQDHLFYMYFADQDHLKTMGYTMTRGRFFSRDFPSDSTAVILNEAAAKQLGWQEDFEGKSLVGYFNSPEGTTVRVIGIMKDFNFESLKNTVKPMAILLGPSPNYEMAIRVTPGNTQEKIKIIESLWKKYAPQAPFEYSFLDENFDAQFRAEQRMGNIILIFTCLAVLIACLGLYGLASFTAEQRSKEISIRKVMGATVGQMMVLLSKDFTKLVVISFLIAIPFTWYAMNQWLQGFPYRIGFDAFAVLIAGVLSVAIAIFTISFQALKAAMGNPVNSLRSE